MNLRILFGWAALVAGLMAGARADQAPAAPPVPAELTALVEKTRAKLAAGERTEAALAEELKGFDALIAAHRGEKNGLSAELLWMKTSLYLQVFEDYERAGELLRQIKADYPDSEPAKNVDGILAGLEAQKESLKLQAALKPGTVFPDFAEKDLAGEPLSVARFKGKIVLVDFWATWCGPCVAELPNVLAAFEKFHPQGFEVIGISLDRSEAALKKFIAEKKMPWPQYFDGKGWESGLGRRYGVNSIPATYLLDGEGRIIAKNLRGRALEAELAKRLGK